MILSSFVWILYQRVTYGLTDGQTDGIAAANTALCIVSNAAALLKCKQLGNDEKPVYSDTI